MITAFHSKMKSTVRYDRVVSNALPIKSGIKHGCALTPTLFGIFFSPVLYHASITSEEGIYNHTTPDRKLFNLARLKAKSEIRKVLIRELLFVVDAALRSHSAERIWPDNQHQEGEHHGSGCQQRSIHQHQRAHPRSCPILHLLGLNDNQQPVH